MQRTAFTTIITVVRVAGGLALANAPHSIGYRPRAKCWCVIRRGKIVSNRRSISTCISPLEPPDRLSSVRGSVTPGHCSDMAGTAKAIKVGIIGGSGLDNPDLLENRQEHKVTTPFGEPSDVLISGRIGHVSCVLLARHGRQHSVMPSKVNYRANIWALKKIGCTHVIATTACGSLNDRVKPGHIVLLDQFLDRTTKRATTFYDGEKDSPKGVCHIPAATPFHEGLRQVLIKTMRAMKIEFHDAGTVVTIEGPRFSTRFESCLFRSWHCDVINMTTVPEVVLAKEAGLLYASIALVTDYDSWRLDLQHVDVTAVLETMKCNSAVALKVLRAALPNIAAIDWSDAIKEAQEEVDRAVMK